MNVLILGSGGREHVFAHKISQSKHCENLYIATGNAGTAKCGVNLSISPMDFEAIANFCVENKVDLVVPGNEDPLVAGIVDFLAEQNETSHILVCGPSKAGAQLEGSKDFSKALMQKYKIPTAAYITITKDNINEGYSFLDTMQAPYVLKADGLAAGKGVLIVNDLTQAKADLKEMIEGKFGNASTKVVIEEFLHGIELSCFVLSDGENYVMLPEAKDYKRIGEGDTGLNTGGMGAISPVPFADKAFLNKVEELVVKPSIEGLKNENIPYKGFLFIGLMNVGGEPKVIEYNCRMGDPETEVVLHRLKNDMIELLSAASNKTLSSIQLDVDPHYASTVFLVSGGYPESYDKGYEISGLSSITDSTVYQAGTKQVGDKIVTNGGRVLALTSTGTTLQEALDKSMKSAEQIQFTKKVYRKDIGQDLLKYYEQNQP
ncbi:MAG: phosphoribosylamine--glycine ligase [Bacteroidia bacterium]